MSSRLDKYFPKPAEPLARGRHLERAAGLVALANRLREQADRLDARAARQVSLANRAARGPRKAPRP